MLRAVDQGRKRSEIVAMFAISLATLKRYLKRQRETGDVRAKSIPGRPAKKGTALQAGLLSQLDAYPDATLAEHCRIWKNTEAGAGQFYDDEPLYWLLGMSVHKIDSLIILHWHGCLPFRLH
jgi:transposase